MFRSLVAMLVVTSCTIQVRTEASSSTAATTTTLATTTIPVVTTPLRVDPDVIYSLLSEIAREVLNRNLSSVETMLAYNKVREWESQETANLTKNGGGEYAFDFDASIRAYIRSYINTTFSAELLVKQKICLEASLAGAEYFQSITGQMVPIEQLGCPSL